MNSTKNNIIFYNCDLNITLKLPNGYYTCLRQSKGINVTKGRVAACTSCLPTYRNVSQPQEVVASAEQSSRNINTPPVIKDRQGVCYENKRPADKHKQTLEQLMRLTRGREHAKYVTVYRIRILLVVTECSSSAARCICFALQHLRDTCWSKVASRQATL